MGVNINGVSKMRKIDDTKMLKMLNEGKKSQREVAKYFEVSEAAISKRIRLLKSYEPPESFTKLTDKQQAFVLAKVEGKSNLDAVKTAYNITSNESGKSLATNLMKDPDVNTAIQDLMYSEGIGRRYRVQRLRAMIDSKDLTAVGRGLDMSFKLDGSYAPEKHIVEVDHEALVMEISKIDIEIKRLEDELARMPAESKSDST